MLAWAQNRGEYKKYTEIPLSSGEEKHMDMFVAVNTTE